MNDLSCRKFTTKLGTNVAKLHSRYKLDIVKER